MTNAEAFEDGPLALLARENIDRLIQALRAAGYSVIGPAVEAGAIVYRPVAFAAELPEGWGSRQDAGHYRLERRTDKALFGYVSAVQSWKRYLFQPSRVLWQSKRLSDGFSVQAPEEPVPRYAFLGARACEIAAIQLQDRVFIDCEHPDPDYKARREAAFIVAVHCTEAGDTCFCTSMNTGPAVRGDYDIALTELLVDGRHDYLLQTGSERGRAIAEQLPLLPANDSNRETARAGVAAARASMGRKLETKGLKDLIQQNQEHSHWQQLAERCLACTNCTAVCPTCFCHTTEDVIALDGQSAERRQRWDSCFSLDFSHLTHGSVRSSVKARYRQWMSHKLAHWVDQFGEFGCVGCGRCVTWCPAGIDITAEAAALRHAVEGGE